MAAWLAGPAGAQVSASAALDSDYGYRGISLSDGRPTLTLSASYDDRSGVYAGLAVIGVATRASGPRLAGYVVSAGYARRLADGASWDIGVTQRHTEVWARRQYASDYVEIHAGYARGPIAAHISLSPDYIGLEGPALYADVDAVWRPSDRWRLFAHAGVLEALGERPDGGRARLDVRAGVARSLGRLEAHLSATIVSRTAQFPPYSRQPRARLRVGLSWYF